MLVMSVDIILLVCALHTTACTHGCSYAPSHHTMNKFKNMEAIYNKYIYIIIYV